MSKSRKLVLGGHDKVKVAIAQISSAYLDRDATIGRAVAAIGEAARNGAQLVVFSEVWLSGYPFWSEGWDSDLRSWVQGRVAFRDAALLVPSADTERLGAAARQHGVYLVMGCNEIDPRPESDTIYNTLIFFGPDGALLGRHRKLMPTFGERQFWGQGDGSDIRVFETDIGRIGGLICGEHVMTLARATMIAEGEEIHIATFPGSFALHTGPRLQEADTSGSFFGYPVARAHAIESGGFVLLACGYQDPADVPDDFVLKSKMHVGWANGGSSIIAPLCIPLVEPQYGAQMIYGELEAWMIKAMRSIVDTMGHYGRSDVFKLLLRQGEWREAGSRGKRLDPALADQLKRAAETHDVDDERVLSLAVRHAEAAE
ncbi:MAG: carbon-nitrogen hydrolase family protein [Rhodospirillaceae bacterium]|nr:carbon-nitrogen hydrolase family protein [Rhodospirillaceae bacterium]